MRQRMSPASESPSLLLESVKATIATPPRLSPTAMSLPNENESTPSTLPRNSVPRPVVVGHVRTRTRTTAHARKK